MDEPPELDPVVSAMRRCTVETNRFAEAVARNAGIGAAEMHAIGALQMAGGSLTPGRLGERLQLSSGAVTALADRLEGHGFVERVPHPTDRRTLLLRLTDKADLVGQEAFVPFVVDLGALTHDLPDEVRFKMAAFLSAAAEVAARHAERQAQLTRAARPGSKPPA